MSEEPKKPSPPDENYGFNYYPNRRAEKKEFSLMDKLFVIDKDFETCKKECERKVIAVMKNHPLIKVLLGALRKAGCPVKLKRHIVCEECDSRVTGGYDCEYNQIVVCQNSFKSRKLPEAVLVHELIHMYDYCVGKIDFTNLDHLACTEIRAANIAHCSFLSSFFLGQSSIFNIKKSHQYCVKMKAAQSMMLARNIDFETAMEHILKVFDKCYKDLEPIGRRVKRGSVDPDLALKEARHFNLLEENS